jgi:hypothetical protein
VLIVKKIKKIACVSFLIVSVPMVWADGSDAVAVSNTVVSSASADPVADIASPNTAASDKSTDGLTAKTVAASKAASEGASIDQAAADVPMVTVKRLDGGVQQISVLTKQKDGQDRKVIVKVDSQGNKEVMIVTKGADGKEKVSVLGKDSALQVQNSLRVSIGEDGNLVTKSPASEKDATSPSDTEKKVAS